MCTTFLLGCYLNQRTSWRTSEAYEKLSAALNKTSLTKAIKKASSVEQTSALEGYHSVINQFAPKMYAFSYLGMFCRTILAALHFNYYIKRETKVDEVGNPIFRVTYPNFKDGEATVREAKVSANFDYVTDIYDILTKTTRAELKLLEEELKGEVPDPINTMLDRESREGALSKYQTRKEKTTVLCPQTCPGTTGQGVLPGTTNITPQQSCKLAIGHRPQESSEGNNITVHSRKDWMEINKYSFQK